MTDIKMSKVVVLIVGIVIFVGVFGVYLIYPSQNNYHEDNLLIKTLRASGATEGTVSINGWKRIDDKGEQSEELTLWHIARTLNPNQPNPAIKTLHSRYSSETTTTIKISQGLKAKLTIIESVNNAKTKGERYLVISLEGDSTTEMLESMERIYSNVMGKDSQKSIVLRGIVDGYLSPLQKDVLVEKMMKSAQVQKVEKLETKALVSVTGYAPNVHSLLTLSGKSVNINMALRYNSVQNRTMVYVGSPVITSEY